MTASEHFVSRWARLKSQSDNHPKAEVSTETPSLHRQVQVVDEPFDPASLPSIETIRVDTDVRGFLQSHVPAALTRAALRLAWASDPAIRDFIGIAENQWDFNDPTAMPGFGPMLETDNLPALLARALGGHDKLADMMAEIPTPVESALPSVTDREPNNPDRPLQRSSENSPSANDICNAPDDGHENAAAENDRDAEADEPPPSRRSHGGALPR